jgi:hypothetical protein
MLRVWAARAFYTLSMLQVCSFYLVYMEPYLNYANYMSGHERNPFQQRILPVPLLWALLHTPPLVWFFVHLKGLFLPVERGAAFILSFTAMSVAGYFTMKLHDAVSPRRSLPLVVYLAFLYTAMSSYVILVQMHFFYPYDTLSLAFFTAGIYFIYTRKFVPLLLVMLVGTFNRETTLFLVPIFMIDAASREDLPLETPLWRRLDVRWIPWMRVAALVAVWVGIKLFLGHIFAHNDRSEDYIRIRENMHLFLPKHWPALLNICGYLLPVVLVLRKQIVPQRFANYLLVFPIWFAVMLTKGILIETRIYGELSGYTAVAAVLLLERYMAQESLREARNANSQRVAETTAA